MSFFGFRDPARVIPKSAGLVSCNASMTGVFITERCNTTLINGNIGDRGFDESAKEGYRRFGYREFFSDHPVPAGTCATLKYILCKNTKNHTHNAAVALPPNDGLSVNGLVIIYIKYTLCVRRGPPWFSFFRWPYPSRTLPAVDHVRNPALPMTLTAPHNAGHTRSGDDVISRAVIYPTGDRDRR